MRAPLAEVLDDGCDLHLDADRVQPLQLVVHLGRRLNERVEGSACRRQGAAPPAASAARTRAASSESTTRRARSPQWDRHRARVGWSSSQQARERGPGETEQQFCDAVSGSPEQEWHRVGTAGGPPRWPLSARRWTRGALADEPVGSTRPAAVCTRRSSVRRVPPRCDGSAADDGQPVPPRAAAFHCETRWQLDRVATRGAAPRPCCGYST